MSPFAGGVSYRSPKTSRHQRKTNAQAKLLNINEKQTRKPSHGRGIRRVLLQKHEWYVVDKACLIDYVWLRSIVVVSRSQWKSVMRSHNHCLFWQKKGTVPLYIVGRRLTVHRSFSPPSPPISFCARSSLALHSSTSFISFSCHQNKDGGGYIVLGGGMGENN